MSTKNFLDNGQSPLEQANVVVLPIPFEGAISYMSGAARGPHAILEASAQVELYDFENGTDLSELSFHTGAATDLPDYEAVRGHVLRTLEKIGAAQFYLGLGGDHTVTIPAIEFLSKKHPKMGIVQIDAHADLREALHGDRYSHACIMRRNAEIIGPHHVLSVGIRAVSEEEKEYMDAHGVHSIPGGFSLHENLVPRFRELLDKIPDDVFLTVDLDGLDPSVIPHVGTPVPGGLSWFQTMEIIKELFLAKNVIAADIVEIASGPGTQRSDFTAALLAQKIVSLWAKKRKLL